MNNTDWQYISSNTAIKDVGNLSLTVVEADSGVNWFVDNKQSSGRIQEGKASDMAAAQIACEVALEKFMKEETTYLKVVKDECYYASYQTGEEQQDYAFGHIRPR